MPWRVSPQARKDGQQPNPYHIWLSEVMLQQTTVAAVRDYFVKFTTTWPHIHDLAASDDAEVMAAWAGLGYYARARNLLKCARIVTRDHNGRFPEEEQALLKLPGIGPYTAAAIAAIAFDRRAVVLDGNVERVMARLENEHSPLPRSKELLRGYADHHTPDERAGDYAQAVMDLGATICTPKSPSCDICPIKEDCKAQAKGTAATLPRKDPRKEKPTRYGHAYVACSPAGDVFLIRRPDKGLLGGMLAWPSTEWLEEQPAQAPPFPADWQELKQVVRHTFTHFHLILTVHHVITPDEGEMTQRRDFHPSALPTVMRKVWNAVEKEIEKR